MERAEIDRVRRALRQRPKPPWRLPWTERLRRDLAPIYRFVACRRGRHRDAQVMADDLSGSDLGDAYPEVAICEVCDRAVDWPNGTSALQPVATPHRSPDARPG